MTATLWLIFNIVQKDLNYHNIVLMNANARQRWFHTPIFKRQMNISKHVSWPQRVNFPIQWSQHFGMDLLHTSNNVKVLAPVQLQWWKFKLALAARTTEIWYFYFPNSCLHCQFEWVYTQRHVSVYSNPRSNLISNLYLVFWIAYQYRGDQRVEETQFGFCYFSGNDSL